MKPKIINALVLVLILLLGIGLFWYSTGNKSMQLLVGFITSLGYVAWGIIHHALDGTLHKKVVIEYILVGFIAIVLIMTILL